MSTKKTFKLAELAPLLCPDCDEETTYRVSRKIQNWVTAGLIRPVGDKHSGRGVHRQYDDYELCKARVLLELGHFHVPNTVLQLAADLLDDCNPARESQLTRRSEGRQSRIDKMTCLMMGAIKGEKTVYLMVEQSGTGTLSATFSTDSKINPEWRSAVVLNLTQVIKKTD